MSERRKEMLDNLIQRFTSRKLMVFGISVAALFLEKIDADSWVIISTAYIGGETIIDAVTRLKGLKN